MRAQPITYNQIKIPTGIALTIRSDPIKNRSGKIDPSASNSTLLENCTMLEVCLFLLCIRILDAFVTLRKMSAVSLFGSTVVHDL